MRSNTRFITENAIIACAYAVLTLAIAPLAYSEIQFRISEIMVFLAFYNKKWIPGLIIGCFIANLASPLGLYDVIFGTLSTIIVCLAMNKVRSLLLATFLGGLITGVIIGFELHLAFGIPFVINAIYVAIGEWGVLLIGTICFKYIEKNKRFLQLLN